MAKLATKCECGNVFMGDSKFCRQCGKPRPHAALNDEQDGARGKQQNDGYLWIHLGRCKTQLGKWDEGEQHMRRGLQELVQNNDGDTSAIKIAEVRVEISTLLRREGEFEKSTQELNLAEAAASRLGAQIRADIYMLRGQYKA